MFLLEEFKKRVQIVRNPSKSGEKRIFALLELIVSPLSFSTIFLFLPVSILLSKTDALEPEALGWLEAVLQILLAAAIGYLTNFLALEMLFKPFRPEKWHFFSIMTLGFWKQGLVPRNKDQLGVEIGRQVEEKLLDPKTIAADLTSGVVEILQNPQTTETIRRNACSLLLEHQNQITEFLLPHMENSLTECARSLLTSENIKAFSQDTLLPLLESEKVREIVASKIADALKSQAPQFMETLREMVQEYVESFLKQNPITGNPFVGAFVGELATGFISFVNWQKVQEMIEEKLSGPEIVEFIGNEMANLSNACQSWLDSPESSDSLEKFRSELQECLRSFLKEYLKTRLPVLLNRLLEEPTLWRWAEREFVPNAQKALEKWSQTEGLALIIEKLRLSHRVQEAVKKQDVEEFYQMITNVAAEQLGAIQVLGFILGAAVGLIQLLL